jgi:hypothetical protein
MTNIATDIIIKNWLAQNTYLNNILSKISDENLVKETAPGKKHRHLFIRAYDCR